MISKINLHTRLIVVDERQTLEYKNGSDANGYQKATGITDAKRTRYTLNSGANSEATVWSAAGEQGSFKLLMIEARDGTLKLTLNSQDQGGGNAVALSLELVAGLPFCLGDYQQAAAYELTSVVVENEAASDVEVVVDVVT